MYKLGIQILVNLFEGDERWEFFKEVSSNLPANLWKVPKDSKLANKESSLDKIIASHLIKGLQQSKTMKHTLWLVQMLYRAIPIEGQTGNLLLVMVLLTHYTRTIAERSIALEAYKSIKLIGMCLNYPLINVVR